ncbi:MAG: hypothetical protein HYV63_24090 [Candidatus Schekmanbacteria bacterium]|nr:hypothetical protein [Candidatus Schekmanbacteria bacterium]
MAGVPRIGDPLPQLPADAFADIGTCSDATPPSTAEPVAATQEAPAARQGYTDWASTASGKDVRALFAAAAPGCTAPQARALPPLNLWSTRGLGLADSIRAAIPGLSDGAIGAVANLEELLRSDLSPQAVDEKSQAVISQLGDLDAGERDRLLSALCEGGGVLLNNFVRVLHDADRWNRNPMMLRDLAAVLARSSPAVAAQVRAALHPTLQAHLDAGTAQLSGPANLDHLIGTPDYYRARYEDFKRRYPNLPAPDYYLGYGDKYARRFLEQTRPQLSPRGQRWLDQTFRLLQTRMEELRRRDPAAFDRLERDPDAFRQFAYQTHPDAYLQAGLSLLPVEDLKAIALTPDLEDLATRDGIEQMADAGQRTYLEWILRWGNMPFVPGLPHRPAGS